MRALALKAGVWLLLGGFPEKCAQAGPHPQHIRAARSGGEIAAIYRKMHLFDVDVPGGKRFRESETVEPGGDVVVAPTPWGGPRPQHLLRPALPRAVPRARGAGRAPDRRPVGVHARDRQGSLARAAARARDREPGLRDGARAVRRARRRHGAATGTRWSSIRGAWSSPSAATTRASRSRGSTSRYQDKIRAALPCLTHRRL